ncbi:zinc finger MYM-type protein 1-like [Cynara cardunculus var. scolymus]|uniref:zinc finger MYM-type protein 1-like n=1 Tax=Cynara cardunculus var. scolymus TaxID=59895 RepID=UPI000D62E1B6|nr:zinc finger MYM-type protein 1-like [Cynara cardunculus var. scolymus]
MPFTPSPDHDSFVICQTFHTVHDSYHSKFPRPSFPAAVACWPAAAAHRSLPSLDHRLICFFLLLLRFGDATAMVRCCCYTHHIHCPLLTAFSLLASSRPASSIATLNWTNGKIRLILQFCRQMEKNALPFRGHDESEMSISKGMFLETLALIGDCNEDVGKVVLKNAPKNDQMVSPSIQKDIVACFANQILKSICKEVGDDVFSLLVDESSDVSKKEQKAVVLRYVDARGIVKERFFGIVHVRAQGYDGASNMRGEFNGLKALILNENSLTYHIHCFAHQLQLVVVAVANKHDGVENFFNMLGMVINVVNASCKRKDMLRQSYKDRVQEAIGKCEVETGTGKYEELSLIRAEDTRWGSHYKTILSLIALFLNVVEVL